VTLGGAVLLAALAWYQTRPEVPTPYLLAAFSTELARDEWARNDNVRIAAGKITGTYLHPGQQFSFNALVGVRTEEEGYHDAPVYTPVGKMDVLGGGLCQLSSTIYNAALLAGLAITERHPHGLTVRYLVPGRDATVSECSDLKFRNGMTSPIRVLLSVEGRRLGCSIYGARPLGCEVRVEVTTSTLPDGRIMARAERLTYKDGALLSREALSEDVYRPSQ
jgi:vancomycin resistance protein YoaR